MKLEQTKEKSMHLSYHMQNRNYELALLTARYWECPRINQEICLEFDLKKPIKEQLKRGILKHIFDPLGLISPVPITGKDMYQEACDPKFSWDEQQQNH